MVVNWRGGELQFGLVILSGFETTSGSRCLTAAAGGAGIFDRLFNRFTGFAGALLNAAQEFFLLAFDILQIIVGEFGPLLFQLALGDVPVTFYFQCRHNT